MPTATTPFPSAHGLTLVSSSKTFDGYLNKYSLHAASYAGLKTAINVFLPATSLLARVPTLIFLAGVSGDEDTGPQKISMLLESAAAHGLAMVFVDTSPRGANIPGEADTWGVGVGAGAYIDATREPWKQYYKMETFITVELLEVLSKSGLPLLLSRESLSILGHSMGGHGALTLYFKHPELFRCVSAFAPAASPGTTRYGDMIFPVYFEGGKEEGKKHDATELVRIAAQEGRKVEAIIDIGTEDARAQGLGVPSFEAAVRDVGYDADGSIVVSYREGYDHGFFFLTRLLGPTSSGMRSDCH